LYLSDLERAVRRCTVIAAARSARGGESKAKRVCDLKVYDLRHVSSGALKTDSPGGRRPYAEARQMLL
jgi:hypothetical protein